VRQSVDHLNPSPPGAIELKDTGERLIPEAEGRQLMYAEHAARYRYAARFARGGRILDLACGVGYGARMLAQAAPNAKVFGVDLSLDTVRYARLHHNANNANFLPTNALALPFADASFDLVVAFEIIEHVAQQSEMLAEVRRVLKPDGLLIVSTPNRMQSLGGNPFHVRELSESEFRDLLGTNFPSVEILYQGNVLASYLSRGQVFPDLHELHNGYCAVVGTPVRRDESLFMVAVCGRAPLSPAEADFDGGACLTRNDEYHAIRAMLAERSRQIAANTQRILDQDRLIHALQQNALVRGAQGDADPGVLTAMIRDLTGQLNRLGEFRRQLDEVSARLEARDRQQQKLHDELGAAIHLVESLAKDVKEAGGRSLRDLRDQHLAQEYGMERKLTDIVDKLRMLGA